jgi:Lrp/AsnC family transcriptional regulator
MDQASEFDKIDLRLLAHLQEDASLSVADLADKIHLSANACWRRIKRLEELKVIQKRVALLNREKLGLGAIVFVNICAPDHSEEWFLKFSEGIEKFAEVVEFYRMSGETDYLLKILVTDVSAYDRFYKKLIKIAPISDVSSTFALEQLKATTALPLPRKESTRP